MSVAASPEVYCPPTHLWVPPGSTFEAGAEAADLGRAIGYDIAQPERDALNVLLAEDEHGDWAALETGIISPRQQIKTAMLEVSCWRDLLIRDVRRVTWSAHLYKTTRDAFADMKRIVDTYDWVAAKVNKVRESNGEEGFEFVNGATMDFLARSKGSGRGLGGDTVVLDEALFLSTDTQGALIPTLSTAPKAHVRYGSSPGKLESVALRALRDRARTLADPSLCWIEWSTPLPLPCEDPSCTHVLDSPGCALDDMELVARVNVALDRRMTRRYVEAERRSLGTDPWEFLRERLGVWQDPPDDAADDILADWSLRGSSSAPSGALSLGIDVAVDDRGAAIVACGAGVLEVVDSRLGHPGWVPHRIAELRAEHPIARVGLLRNSPAKALIGRIPDLVELDGVRESQAAAAFVAAVSDGRVTHRGQRVLDRAVEGARRKLSGDGWRWSRSESAPVDISPLMAAVVARWLDDSPETPYDPLANFMPNL